MQLVRKLAKDLTYVLLRDYLRSNCVVLCVVVVLGSYSCNGGRIISCFLGGSSVHSKMLRLDLYYTWKRPHQYPFYILARLKVLLYEFIIAAYLIFLCTFTRHKVYLYSWFAREFTYKFYKHPTWNFFYPLMIRCLRIIISYFTDVLCKFKLIARIVRWCIIFILLYCICMISSNKGTSWSIRWKC